MTDTTTTSPTLTKIVKGGTITVEIWAVGTHCDRFRVAFNGEIVAKVDGLVSLGDRAATINGTRITHALHMSKVGLTLDEAEVLSAPGREARANDPILRMSGLVTRRQSLVGAVRGAREDRDAEIERLHDRQDARAYTLANSANPALDAARAALRAFDAAHPEVIAHIEAERTESAERNRWN